MKIGLSDSLIIKRTDGKELHDLMMKQYSSAMKINSREADKNYFFSQLNMPTEIWLREKFHNKPTYEALISLFLLQKDIALVSAIEIHTDDDFMREELDRQYNKLENNMREK